MTTVTFHDYMDFANNLRSEYGYSPDSLFGGGKKVKYANIPFAFDIETTSTYQGEKCNENKRAFMYIWQFGYQSPNEAFCFTYGRDWLSFVTLVHEISDILKLDNEHRICIYVHNLAFEFSFIQKLFDWDNVFFRDFRKPIYALVHGVEFRCSMMLSGGKSLKTVGDELLRPVAKQVGDLDYLQVRSESTPLTETEMEYCRADIVIILEYIREKIENEGHISTLPLTNTGYVRRHMRDCCFRKQEALYRGHKETDPVSGFVPCCKRGIQWRSNTRESVPCKCHTTRCRFL